MMRLVRGMLALSLAGAFTLPALVAQDVPALTGFTLGSHRSDFALEDCGPPRTSAAPEGKQDVVCVANDSVGLQFADDELYLVTVIKWVDVTPTKRWEEMRDWVTHMFGEPDSVPTEVADVLLTVAWRANATRPWQLTISVLAGAPGTLSIMEYVDCRRARPGYCTGSER